MAVCLEYQSVYLDRRRLALTLRMQFVAALILLGALAFKIWVKIEATNLGYDLAAERKATVEYDLERRELELQLSVLTRSDSLAKKAREKLGLLELNPMQARRIRVNN